MDGVDCKPYLCTNSLADENHINATDPLEIAPRRPWDISIAELGANVISAWPDAAVSHRPRPENGFWKTVVPKMRAEADGSHYASSSRSLLHRGVRR